MHRCPGCDQPNHGTDRCDTPYVWMEYSHPTSTGDAEEKKEKKIFIGSGEDADLFGALATGEDVILEEIVH